MSLFKKRRVSQRKTPLCTTFNPDTNSWQPPGLTSHRSAACAEECCFPPSFWYSGDGPADDHDDLQLSSALDGALESEATLLSVASDGREGVWVLAAYKADTLNRLYDVQFTFVGVRRTACSNGHVWTSWCSNSACFSSSRYSGVDYPHMTAGELEASRKLCPCAQLLFDAHGGGSASTGEPSMLRVLSSSDEFPGLRACAGYHQEFEFGGRNFWAVQTGDDFSSWGVVGFRKGSSEDSERSRCYTCTRAKETCSHVQQLVLDGQVEEPSSRHVLSPEVFEERLKEDFDVSTGQPKLRCITRGVLPARLDRDTPELLEVVNGLKKGTTPLPPQIRPAMPAVCSQCGGSEWQEVVGPECTVFLYSHITSTRFVDLKCTSCASSGFEQPAVVSVDGPEAGLLRQSETQAFGLDLLYHWRDKMKHKPESMFEMWRHYVTCQFGADLAVQRLWFNRRDAAFCALLDFLHLQRLDLEAAFWCEHMEDGGRVACDCITVGIHKGQSFLCHPWVDRSGDVVQGSTFADRIFVPRPAARGLLVGLCRQAGISPQALSDLRAQIAELPEGSPAHTLLPFLEDQHMVEGAEPGNVAAPLKSRALLHGLGTDAPVCQLLRPGVYAVVDQLLQPSTVLADDQQGVLESTCPVLFRFLQPDLQQPLPDSVRNLLAAMREVSERAFTPAPPQQQQQRRRRQPAASGGTGDSDGQAAGMTSGERNYAAALAAGLPAAGEWRSRVESLCRSGQWGGRPTRDEWQPTEHGGSHVLRPLPLYAKDSKGRRSCTKHKDQSGVLTPGLLLFWCLDCRKCVFFQLLSDTESPAAVFNALRLFWPAAPRCLVYDNGCNVHDYCLNREPEFFKETEFYIDQPHFAGHAACCAAYNTAEYPKIKCSTLPEQKNSDVRQLEGHVSYMRQARALLYLRYYLYLLNEGEDDKAAGRKVHKS